MDDYEQLRNISLKALHEGRAEELIRVLHSEEDFLSYSSNQLLTYQHMVETWLENFRDNLPIIGNGRWMDAIPYDGRPVICVGAGPSMTDNELRPLKDSKHCFVICTNKIAERLLKYRTPDLMVVLHGTDEILPHFQGPRVGKALRNGMPVALPTVASPKVVTEVISRTQSVWWFNASVPNTENVDSMMKLMTHGLPTFDTGGNVGLCSMIIAMETLGAKVIGFMGMETCKDLKEINTDSMASMCDIVYMPERKQLFAVPPSFKDYAISMGSVIRNANDRCDFVNLTPVGIPFLSAASWGIRNASVVDFLMEQKDYMP